MYSFQQLQQQCPPHSFTPIQCDLRDTSAILAMFRRIREEFAAELRILINNAGVALNSPLLTGTDSDWLEMLQVSCAVRDVRCGRRGRRVNDVNTNGG